MRFPLLIGSLLSVACDSKAESSDTTNDTTPITEGFGIGETPPDFTLTDAEGSLVSLSDYSDPRVVGVGTASW